MASPATWDVVEHLLGPNGGQVALAFGAGAAAGWAFCMRTLYKVMKERRDADHEEAKARIVVLEEELTSTRERLFGEMRQHSQMRHSEIVLLDRKALLGSQRLIEDQSEDKDKEDKK